MGIFSSSFEILYRIEKKGEDLHVTFRNWTWWYLEYIVIIFVPALLLTLFSSIFIQSNTITFSVFTIVFCLPFFYVMHRRYNELGVLQNLQRLASIKFTPRCIILEPTKKSILMKLFLERPMKSGEHFEIPIDSIISLEVRPLLDDWFGFVYALYANGCPVSPSFAKVEYVEEYYIHISKYFPEVNLESVFDDVSLLSHESE